MPEPSGTGATSGPGGAGPTPERRRSIETLVGDTRIPSFPSSQQETTVSRASSHLQPGMFVAPF